ncbi:MAG: YggS family pyridoxal phosphate-dependent enzyme [Acidimicrobiales bacterium]
MTTSDVAGGGPSRSNTLEARLSDLRNRVAGAGGDPARIRIVAVTKGWGASTVAEAAAAGLLDVGENYAQELVAKAVESPTALRWHFLGPVQRNKVHRLAPFVSTWHAIDREAAVDAVAAASPDVEVLVQVNLAGGPSRPGCRPGDVDDLVAHCRRRRVSLTGLMTVGPAADAAKTRECFRWLAGRARQLGLRELSMGMSDDFEVAVAEGATTLRLGRVLFGPRPSPLRVQR